MSWQSKFDSSGPTWGGNAAAIAEEKRLEKMMEDLKVRSATSSDIDQSLLDDLDAKMKQLHGREQELMKLLEDPSSINERAEIKSHISELRRHFYNIKGEYMRIRRKV